MKDNSAIKNKVDAVLTSIDQITPANPSPYFYTRLMAKMSESKNTFWERWSAVFLRPAITFASIGFIIIVNAFVLYSKFDQDLSPATQNEQPEIALSDGYIETVTPLYDLENVKQ